MRIGSLIRDLADFCFPPACAACDAAAESAAAPLCERCLATFQALERAASCDRCGLPIAETGAPCPHCLGAGLRPFDRVYCLTTYAEPVRHLVHRLKFHHAWGIGEFLADRMFRARDVRDALAAADVIVPVPLHPLRQLARGYNQAEVIARRLAALAGKRVRHPAERLVNTAAQTDVQSRTHRIANLRRAFGLIDASVVAGRRIVVVDDVRTTAATLQSFGRCLKAGKPTSLSALLVAAADPRGADFETI